MADNVQANPGAAGAVFATDEISSVHYPRSKVVWGPDGTVNDADVASGKPLPVQLYGKQSVAGDTAIIVDSSGRPIISLKQVNGSDIDTNSGNKSAGTVRVVIATDQPSLSNALTVDTELPAAAALADGLSNPTTPMDGACLLVFNGATWDRLRAANVHKDLSAVSIGSIATVWTPASGKKVRLMGGTISLSAAASILFEDNSAGTTVWRTGKLLADTPYNFDLGQGVLLAAANNVLKATSSASASVTGTLYGTEE